LCPRHRACAAGRVDDVGEVLVSGTVTDLVAGSELRFHERDPATLKGIPGERRVYELADPLM
jgi:class 3 adenylate cyclase